MTIDLYDSATVEAAIMRFQGETHGGIGRNRFLSAPDLLEHGLFAAGFRNADLIKVECEHGIGFAQIEHADGKISIGEHTDVYATIPGFSIVKYDSTILFGVQFI